MLYMPSVFGESLMDDWFEDMDRNFFGKKNPLYGHNAQNMMKTDVREIENGYEMDIELPGFHKEDISISLDQGYLKIQAQKGLNKEEKDEKSGKVIRRERYAGSLARTFYVGQNLTEEDIKAKLEDGVLKLSFPKEDKRSIPEKKTILIEG